MTGPTGLKDLRVDCVIGIYPHVRAATQTVINLLRQRAAGEAPNLWTVSSMFDVANLVADAMLAPGEDWDTFLATFLQRGRSRIELQVRIPLPEGGIAAELAGRYVAIAKG